MADTKLKALEWAALASQRPKGPGRFSEEAFISDDGRLCIMFKGALSPDEALLFGQWLIEVYGPALP
jgi:hypothetical protein